MWSDVLFIHLGSRYLKGNFFGLLPLQVASYRRRLTSFLTFFNITRAACSPTWAFHSCSCQGKQDLYLSLNINQSSTSVLQHCCHVFTWPSVNSHLGHLWECVSVYLALPVPPSSPMLDAPQPAFNQELPQNFHCLIILHTARLGVQISSRVFGILCYWATTPSCVETKFMKHFLSSH